MLCSGLVLGGSLLAFAATTGTITIGGAEQFTSAGVADSGTVTITVTTVNGSYSEQITYGQYSTPASVASALAATFSQDCNSPVRAHAVGAQITFQMRASATTLISLKMTSQQNSAFTSASFTTATSAVSATGQPVITSVMTAGSTTRSTVTLTGFNFGPSGTVTFNGVPGSATSWKPTSITVPIPAGAISGMVYVTTFGMTSNGVPITITSQAACTAQ